MQRVIQISSHVEQESRTDSCEIDSLKYTDSTCNMICSKTTELQHGDCSNSSPFHGQD